MHTLLTIPFPVKSRREALYDLAFRFDNGVQSIFVDGELVTSSQGHANLYSREEFQIGTWGGNFMKGRICDVKIFNRALSIKNISEL